MPAQVLFDVPPAAFTPSPKVRSSVVVLITPVKPEPSDGATCWPQVTAAAFGQRRKMLRQSLKAFAAAQGVELAALFTTAGLDPTSRAEEIDVAGFCALARAAERFFFSPPLRP